MLVSPSSRAVLPGPPREGALPAQRLILAEIPRAPIACVLVRQLERLLIALHVRALQLLLPVAHLRKIPRALFSLTFQSPAASPPPQPTRFPSAPMLT